MSERSEVDFIGDAGDVGCGRVYYLVAGFMPRRSVLMRVMCLDGLMRQPTLGLLFGNMDEGAGRRTSAQEER